MVQSTTSAQVKELGTILGIWAHPDDETFMTGGLMAMAVQNGQTVACVTATRGEAGVRDPLRWSAVTMGATRALELTEALQHLGVTHHDWLRYADGACKDVAEAEVVGLLLPILEKYQPDTIVTFPPDGLTGHDDHKAVSRWASAVASKASKPVTMLQGVTTVEAYNAYFREMDEKFDIYFNIKEPKLYPEKACDLVLELPRDIVQKKCQALKDMPSQYSAWFKEYSFEYLCQAFATESFVKA